jgi:hypothetical protein
LSERKAKLAQLLAGSTAAIVSNEHTDAEARLYSGKPANWAWKASCRSGLALHIGQGRHGTG